MKKSIVFTMLLGSISYGSFSQNVFPENANVGIGTLSPTEKLDVRGNIYWDGFNSGHPRAVKMGYSGGNYGGIGYNLDFTSSTGIFNRPLNDQSSYLEFWHGGFKFFGTSNGAAAQGITLEGSGSNLNLFATITDSGNFGIGANYPVEKLEVNGRIKAGDRIYANSTDVNALSLVQSYNSAGGPSVLRSYSGTSYWDFAASQSAGGNSLFIGKGIDVSTDNAAITVASNNNVGIGTNSPDSKLSVKGNIRAKEVKVETNNWPDYVFAKDYQLPTLQETEKHIKDKGHLPGIPSAADVKVNGVDLGEMNAKLLQKIEELTLHLIGLEKKVDLQNTKLGKQNLLIEKLRKNQK